MAIGIAPTTWFSELPYVTVAEFKNAPTSVSIDNLVVGGNAAAQDAELYNVIMRASSFLDEYLNQNLNASSQIETQRVRFTPEGYIALHPNQDPVISLDSFQYGATPNNLVTLPDCSVAWFEGQQIIIPVSQIATSWSSSGPLSFGGGGSTRQQTFIKYQYTAGYVNSLIETATASNTSLTVQSATGVAAGMQLRIYDGANSETITVASNYVYGSTTVPLTSALRYSHASGIAYGNLPNAIKQACILVTSAFIKVRGDSSMMMQMTVNPSRATGNTSAETLVGDELTLALKMVDLYRRIR